MPQPATPTNQPDTDKAAIQTAIAVVLCGALLIFAVGFIPLDQAHSIAHDVRHLMGFPCH